MGWCDFWKDLAQYPGFGEPLACQAKDAATDAVADAAASAWEEIVQSFQEGAVWMVKELALGWLGVDSPTLSQNSGTVAFLFQSTMFLTTWLAVLSLLLAAGKMAWTRRSEPAREAAAGIFRLIVATSAAVTVINLLTKAGDQYAVWIVNRSIGCKDATASKACVEAFSKKLLEMSTLSNVDQLAISFILALLLMFSGLIQLFSVIFRQAMLFVLTGTLPLAAAASSTEHGRDWWRRSLGWTAAFVLYKPAAGTIYAAAFSQFQTQKEPDLMAQIYGVALLILAAGTLPALMRVVVPLTEHGGTGSGGGMGGTAARLATGALMLKARGAGAAAGAASGGGAGAGKGPGGAGPSGGGSSGRGGGGGAGGGRPGGGSPSGGGPASRGGGGSGGPSSGTPSGGGGPSKAPSGSPSKGGGQGGGSQSQSGGSSGGSLTPRQPSPTGRGRPPGGGSGSSGGPRGSTP